MNTRAFTPTAEQEAVHEAAATGENLFITAGAGTGKTTALVLIAQKLAPRRGLCLVFGRNAARDLRERMPAQVTSSTAHALAYREVGHRYRARLDAPRVPAGRTAEILGITGPLALGETVHLDAAALASLAVQMVDRYCYSADAALAPAHAPRVPGLDRARSEHLAQWLLPFAERAWADLQLPDGHGGQLRHTPNHYFKAWALTEPQLDCDWVALDEAQDTNPVLAKLVRAQQAQKIVVGDAAQRIYGWRGADQDTLDTWSGARRLQLSHSFRFGPPIAQEANVWLAEVGVPLRLTGSPHRESTLGPVAEPDAILCRTNAGAMDAAMEELAQGRTVALLGGAGRIRGMAQAARDLRRGQPTSHPELLAFDTWRQVQDYVEESPADAGELATLVRLVDEHGPDTVLSAAERMVGEEHAQVVCGTVHKAKGAEFDTVRIGSDFREPAARDGVPGPIDRDEAMLAYVAVTRARYRLDNPQDGLGWIHHRSTSPRPAPHPTRRTPAPRPAGAPRPQRQVRTSPDLAAALESTYTYRDAHGEDVTITPKIRDRVKDGHRHISIRGLHPLLADRLDALAPYERSHVEEALRGAVIAITEEITDGITTVPSRDRGRLLTTYQGDSALSVDHVLDLAEELREHLTAGGGAAQGRAALDLKATYTMTPAGRKEPLTITTKVDERLQRGHRVIDVEGLHPLLAPRLARIPHRERLHVEEVLRGAGITITEEIDDGPDHVNGVTYRDRGRLCTDYQGASALSVDHVLDLAEELREQLLGRAALHVGPAPRPVGGARPDGEDREPAVSRRSITRQDLVREITLFLGHSGPEVTGDIDPEAVAEAVVARCGLRRWEDLDDEEVHIALTDARAGH